MSKILIIEDQQAIRNVLRNILHEEDNNYEIDEACDGWEGFEKIKRNNYDLVISDIKMPKLDGIEVLEGIMKIKPEIPFIMISGHGDIDTAIETIKKGAFDYISKPPNLNRLLTTVRNALDRKNLIIQNKTLANENKLLKKKVSKKYEMIGSSPAITEVKEIIEKVAPTYARVLITGPNGAGKELVSHWIHEKSTRAKYPLIEVNCAAIPSELIESELFGHEKGSFTGAHKQKIGKFEQANKGTIFLDEIGDMSLAVQAKVLRALEEKKIIRVGGEKEILVDLRVIAATNKDLREEIEKRNFREDLYHRLAVIIIKVPTLNERIEDIPELVNHFAKKIAKEQGTAVKSFSKKAIEKLQHYDWTGNIRELRNIVERLTILSNQEISEKEVKKFSGK